MPFPTTKGFFDRKHPGDLWDTPSSRYEADSFFLVRKKIISKPFYKPSPLAVTTPKIGGHQPKDMRSKLQREGNSLKPVSRDSIYDIIKQRNPFTAHGEMRTVSVPNPPPYLDAFGTMVSCIDVAILKADLGAHFMKLNLPKFMSKAGMATGLVGLGFSAAEAWEDPTWNNIAQAGTAGVITALAIWGGAACAPFVMVGGVVLIAWEGGEALYEIIQKRR